VARDDVPRVFEGAKVLQGLLEATGTFADVDDVVEAFRLAVKQGAPPQAVIEALWPEEPHFDSPDDARRLFGNLLALHALVASGEEIDLQAAATPKKKKVKTPPPEPFTEEPDDAFVEAAWRYLEDTPKEAQKLSHSFDNTQDALVGWFDTRGLGDDAFGLACALAGDVFAMLTLGGKKPKRLAEKDIAAVEPSTAPEALVRFVDQGVLEAELDAEADALRAHLARAVAALWSRC